MFQYIIHWSCVLHFVRATMFCFFLSLTITLTILLLPVWTSSTSSADPKFSGTKWSTLAIGLHPKVCWESKKQNNIYNKKKKIPLRNLFSKILKKITLSDKSVHQLFQKVFNLINSITWFLPCKQIQHLPVLLP